MPQLNQIIAVRKGLAVRTEREVTDVYKQLQKKDLFGGLSRVYTPRRTAVNSSRRRTSAYSTRPPTSWTPQPKR